MNEKTIDNSHICELAHELTRLECSRLGVDDIDVVDDNGDTRYAEDAQKVFNNYYDIITNILNFEYGITKNSRRKGGARNDKAIKDGLG